MTRRDAGEKIFNYIKENKFTPINIEYGDCYFIFDKGTDGVVHFNIKGLHGWKFAMWIETDADKLKNDNGIDYPAVQFFCQHTLNIDKFKPSRSFFCADISLQYLENEDSWYLYKINDILRMIKRHPYVSFAMDCSEDKFYDGSYLRCYLSQKFYRVSQATKEWCNDAFVRVWHGSKVWFVKKYKVVDSVELIDRNQDGWRTYPRYDMRIHFKKVSDDEQKQDKAEIKMLNVFFRKNGYKNMHLTLTRDGIEHSYSYTIRK
jgi:hypothetical protein